MSHIQVLQLGRQDYATSLRLQETLVELRKQGRIADTLLLVEHDPVITLGRNAKRENIVASAEQLRQQGVELFEINRGGDVTYHGPGQLVGYPICDLRGLPPKIDPESGEPKRIGAVEYVRRLEEVLIRVCAEYGIGTQRVKGLTGVWTQAGSPTLSPESAVELAHAQAKPERVEKKIAAIGVHISRAVTSHGFALNVTTDLDHFQLIVPCGISDKPVTSMARELGAAPAPGGRSLDFATLGPVVTRQFGNVFGLQILWLESLSALQIKDAPANQDLPAAPPDDVKKLEEELRGTGRDDVSFSA